MVKAIIYIEGGGDSKDLHARCRAAFGKLLEKAGFRNRMPRLSACGGREQAYADFKTAFKMGSYEYTALWIDSEEPMDNPEDAWAHLKKRDKWDRPEGAEDEQVLFMTTCMETWIVSDQDTLRSYYGSKLQESALPPLVGLEARSRQDVQEKLAKATRNCTNAYQKGKRSFEVLAELNAGVLETHLPSFARILRILNAKL